MSKYVIQNFQLFIFDSYGSFYQYNYVNLSVNFPNSTPVFYFPILILLIKHKLNLIFDCIGHALPICLIKIASTVLLNTWNLIFLSAYN